MDNTKREDFRRLLSSRLPKAKKAVKLIGNLSRKGQYEYTNLEAQQLIKDLESEVTDLATKFKVTPTPPTTNDITPIATEGELDRNDKSNISWAYDMLERGQINDAKIMLKRVVENFIKDSKAKQGGA
tara:strand:+ start:1239 stop:1622 length:384 start_codon:yes stop_codon:yes gene_type:complete